MIGWKDMTMKRNKSRDKSLDPQFPERIVLAVGFPWAEGTGKKDNPYKSVMMLRNRMGVEPKRIRFPSVLWNPQKLPYYRLVLERLPVKLKKGKE